jgi:hypothetical protein
MHGLFEGGGPGEFSAKKRALKRGKRFANSVPPFCATVFFSHTTTRPDCIAGVGIIDCGSSQAYNVFVIMAL